MTLRNPQTSRRDAWRLPSLALGAAALLLVAGCGHRRVIEQVKGYAYGGAAAPLTAAYAELLVAPVWEHIFIEPEDFIRVRGRIGGTDTVLEVYYVSGEEPPRVSFFQVDGRRRAAKDFAAFLQRTILCQCLRPGPAAPAPAASPAAPAAVVPAEGPALPEAAPAVAAPAPAVGPSVVTPAPPTAERTSPVAPAPASPGPE